jgi:hypothetical protein
MISLSSDGRVLEVKRASDAESVRVAILDQCGDPAVGEPRIRCVRASDGSIIAVYGKHCWATVSLATLAIECTGCD